MGPEILPAGDAAATGLRTTFCKQGFQVSLANGAVVFKTNLGFSFLSKYDFGKFKE